MAASAGRRDVLAVVGMTREAKILGDTPVVIGGGDVDALTARLEDELRDGVAGVISFGLCGALDPGLKVGDLVVGEAVDDGAACHAADRAWNARIAALLPEARFGRFAAAADVVGSTARKAELRERTGAIAVDLESFPVARLARWFGVPFAVVRAVSDAADRTLPPAAQVGLGADGRPAIGRVFASLKSNPWQIGSLIRTALEAEEPPKLSKRQVCPMDTVRVRVRDRSRRHLRRVRKEDGMPIASGVQQQAKGPAAFDRDQNDRHFRRVVAGPEGLGHVLDQAELRNDRRNSLSHPGQGRLTSLSAGE
jgi:hopanoid-associated phosphorylase